MTMQRRRVGIAGEQAALCYLKRIGYTIEQVNYRCPLGELDIVAREGETLVFVEVRSRAGYTPVSPEESITPAKGKKLTRLALHYLQAEYGREMPCRFDLIAVQIMKSSLRVREIRHYRGIIFG